MVTANGCPTLVCQPGWPGLLVVAHLVDHPSFDALLGWSDDAGASSHRTELPVPAGIPVGLA